MGPNPVLKKLGLSENDRVVIIHTDDIGMCHASIQAFKELWEFGIISSGATMVPCPWFLETAKYARENPSVDLGIHVTLTSEWDTYRWGPISTKDPASGLIDEEGFFYRSSEEVQEFGDQGAVEIEIKAQVDSALANGINATHMDTHMGSVASVKFIPSYLNLSMQYKLPPMFLRLDKDGWVAMGLDDQTAELAVQMVSQVEDQGMPTLDRISTLDLDRAKTKGERIEYAKQVLEDIGQGITHFIIHPSVDSAELRAITPDWACRVADYEAFKSVELKKVIKNNGLQVIGYQVLKDLMNDG